MVQDNDLISRAALVEDLSYCAPELFFDKDFLLHKIMRQPTVDAAPVVHGRWVKKNDQGVFYCSECDLPSLQWWPYCEKCGAKMETEISNITKKKFAPSLDDAIKEFNAKWTISGTKMDGGEDVDVGEKASAD